MKWYEKIFFVAWFGFCFALMTQSLARAGDCSGPGDCGSVPDNNSTAAGIGGGLAGGSLAYNSYKKRKRKKKSALPTKPDPCAGERQGVRDRQGDVDLLKDQIGYYQQAMQKLAPGMTSLVQQLQQLAPSVQKEVALHFLQDLAEKILELAAELTVEGEAMEAVNTAVGLARDPSSAIPGKEYADFFQEMWNYYNILQNWGNLDASLQGLEELAQEDGLPDVQKFVDDVKELNGLIGKSLQDQNKIDMLRVDLKEAERKLKDAEQALADCEASHSGDAQSQGDSAAAPS